MMGIHPGLRGREVPVYQVTRLTNIYVYIYIYIYMRMYTYTYIYIYIYILKFEKSKINQSTLILEAPIYMYLYYHII